MNISVINLRKVGYNNGCPIKIHAYKLNMLKSVLKGNKFQMTLSLNPVHLTAAGIIKDRFSWKFPVRPSSLSILTNIFKMIIRARMDCIQVTTTVV